MSTAEKPPCLGVGIQYNPEILDWCPFETLDADVFEVLLDSLMAPLDGPHVLSPAQRPRVERLLALKPLLAHSNYGCEFGFEPLEATAAVQRHVPLSRLLGSPWVADHCFYGDGSWLDIWSSPLQFSAAEVRRCAQRAAQLQGLYGIPLAHENAAYYLPCPGAEMREAEFMARLVDEAGTWLHLDLHNLHTNALNLPGFDIADYLDTIPLERVLALHLAGGSWSGGLYHDWHDSAVPEPVWEWYDEVLSRCRPCAVILEYQGQAHHEATRVLGSGDAEMIRQDLARARAIWTRRHGAVQARPAAEALA